MKYFLIYLYKIIEEKEQNGNNESDDDFLMRNLEAPDSKSNDQYFTEIVLKIINEIQEKDKEESRNDESDVDFVMNESKRKRRKVKCKSECTKFVEGISGDIEEICEKCNEKLKKYLKCNACKATYCAMCIWTDN